MALLLGIDLGTSYFKVGLFDVRGKLHGLGRVAAGFESPALDRAELPVSLFWARLRAALAQAMVQAGADLNDITGISYSSQANTFVLLDAEGRELTPLIGWTDRRAHPLPSDLIAFGKSPEHERQTGLAGIVPERAPAKWLWFAKNEPTLWAKARYLMTISDYLVYSLTGRREGDASTAVLTGLYSLPMGGWWGEGLARFGIEADKLSKSLIPGTAVGHTGSTARNRLGLPAGISLTAGALDHHAAALGAGVGTFADASLSTGTVLAALALVTEVSPGSGRIHGPHADGVTFYRLAFDPAGAVQLEDYQKNAAPGLSLEELLRQAEVAGPMTILALPDAAERTPREHGVAVRSILEKIALVQRRLLQQIIASAPLRSVAATGGGARSPLWVQIQADCLGVPVSTVECAEPACLGAALLAATGAGFFANLGDAGKAMVRPAREYRPRAETGGSTH